MGLVEPKRSMIRSFEGRIDDQGRVQLPRAAPADAGKRAIVTIVDKTDGHASEVTLLSEAALAEDWNRPEEDAAWSHLQPAR